MMFANIGLAMPGALSITLIVVVVLLLFGGKKIPELMRGLGGGIKEFKDASKDDDNSSKNSEDKKGLDS
ncbi:Sec-independent protein translocase subunit TatA/TatB [Nonlabens xiamenensis]|uniref:Sec-independent protein translocase subunit TatA/TatB n=1 Tax=Nonlabens xiamenensis TaxID=2341043 RepID=UPI000F6067A6|nr:twin-arginine translocase TatA/TatE family subunit [Nonlabens xiamenensis]